MTQIFADAFYWIALLNPRDDWHLRVIDFAQTHISLDLITTESVFDEVLNYFAKSGPISRAQACQLYLNVMQDPSVHIIPHRANLRSASLKLYQERPDKQYSFTDCTSMALMKELNIQEILTHDHHFTQEGFIILFP